LEIEVTESGGSFSGRWELKDQALVTLPGQADRWPSQVAASESGGEAKPLPVTGTDLPQVFLEAGSYEIKGVFKWNSPPETLSAPLGPILSVTSLGRRLSFPALDEDPSRGVVRIWLKGRESAPAPAQEREGNRLTVQVDRLIVDSQPMSYRTRLRLIVTGTSREETIKEPLLPDSVPAFLQSPLPARIVGGDLRAQVSPGVHDIFIDSRLKERSGSIGPASGRFGVERWAFVARPYLRQVEVSGAPQIDNSLVDVVWDALPITSLDFSASRRDQEAIFRDFVTYELREGESLDFTEIRRGDPEPSPDNLMLDRRCWLDYDGSGLTCRDTLTGTMRRNFHLSVDKPFSLGQATLNGVPQVITWQRNSKGESAPGLQLRQGALHLTADLRIEDFDHALPASGWDHNLDRTNQFLVLPPGFELLRVSGAMAMDRYYGPSAFWDRWNAFDMFMVLAVVLSAWKLLGLPWAVLALLAMGLSYHEFLAPRLVLLHVLGATALLAVLPPGKASLAARIWRIGSVIFMIFCAAALIILQARLAMYPQLENPDVKRTGPGWPLLSRTYQPDSLEALEYAPYAADGAAAGAGDASFEGMAMEAPAPMAERASRKNAARSQVAEPLLTQISRPKAASLIAQSLNPELMAQNTLARPEWGFRLISLDFNDQVSKDQTAELSIIGPGANRLLRILRIILLAWLVLALAAGRSGPRGFLGPLARLVPKPFESKGAQAGPAKEGPESQEAGPAKKSESPGDPSGGAGPAWDPPSSQAGGPPSGQAGGPPSGQAGSPPSSQAGNLSSGQSQNASPGQGANPGQTLAGLLALFLSSFSCFLSIAKGFFSLAKSFLSLARGYFSLAKRGLSSFLASFSLFFLFALLSIAALSETAWAQDGLPSYEQEGPASYAAPKPPDLEAAPPAFSSGLFPPPELLRELKERLLKEDSLPAPSIPMVSIGPGEASGAIRLRVDFEAAESSLLPLPVIDEEVARFTKVSLASSGADLPLARGRDSVVLALIPEGADAVVIDCLLLPSPGFQIRFSLIPKRVELFSLPGYSLQGLGPEGQPLAGSVFVETGKIEEAPESEVDQTLAAGGQSLEPFFMVDRVLSLGLDWKVLTTVTRYGNAAVPATVSIPLLEDESPTTPGLTVSGGRAVLNFRPGESASFFESSYPINLDSDLTLTANEGPYAESWRLDAANIWRVESSGLVPVHTLTSEGLFNPQWRPWPGESLTLKVTRPEPVPGTYLVIDKATVKTVAGEENRKHALTASLRSSKGGAHSIYLPAGVEIQSFSLGGQTLPNGAPLTSNRGLEVSVP
jgi:hypothetical protein